MFALRSKLARSLPYSLPSAAPRCLPPPRPGPACVPQAELRYITRNTAAARPPLESIPWGLLLSKPATWALIVCHFCHNWGTFILLTWMPTYYNQVLGLDLRSSGLFSVLPWVTMAIAANVGGWIADTLVERGWSVTHVRKLMQTVSAGCWWGAGVALAGRHEGRQEGRQAGVGGRGGGLLGGWGMATLAPTGAHLCTHHPPHPP